MTILSFLLSVINLGKVLVYAHIVRKKTTGTLCFFQKNKCLENKSMWFKLNYMWVFKLFYFDITNFSFPSLRARNHRSWYWTQTAIYINPNIISHFKLLAKINHLDKVFVGENFHHLKKVSFLLSDKVNKNNWSPQFTIWFNNSSVSKFKNIYIYIYINDFKF